MNEVKFDKRVVARGQNQRGMRPILNPWRAVLVAQAGRVIARLRILMKKGAFRMPSISDKLKDVFVKHIKDSEPKLKTINLKTRIPRHEIHVIKVQKNFVVITMVGPDGHSRTVDLRSGDRIMLSPIISIDDIFKN